MKSLFDGLITSKTRIRILMRLFMNPRQAAYVRELAEEFDVSTSLVHEELQQLATAGLVQGSKQGRQIRYRANQGHALFPELQSMVQKALGMDRIVDSIIQRLGNLELAFVMDDYAEGKDTGLIDLVLVGDIDHDNLRDLVLKTEKYIKRKIRTLALTRAEYESLRPSLASRSQLLAWQVNDEIGNEIAASQGRPGV